MKNLFFNVPVKCSLFTGTVPVRCSFTGTIPVMCFLFTGTLPANKLFLIILVCPPGSNFVFLWQIIFQAKQNNEQNNIPFHLHIFSLSRFLTEGSPFLLLLEFLLCFALLCIVLSKINVKLVSIRGDQNVAPNRVNVWELYMFESDPSHPMLFKVPIEITSVMLFLK